MVQVKNINDLAETSSANSSDTLIINTSSGAKKITVDNLVGESSNSGSSSSSELDDTVTEYSDHAVKSSGIYAALSNKANLSHTHSNATISSLDASKITSGTLSIDRLPAGTLDRLVKVADQNARFALTIDYVQVGDTVQQLDTEELFLVVDDNNLGNSNGYVKYTAGAATSVPWSGVTDKPNSYTPSSHTHTISEITDISNANVASAIEADHAANADSATSSSVADVANSVAWVNITNRPTSYVPSSHIHTISEISDLGNANVANANTVNNHTVLKDVPSDAKFTDTTYSVFNGSSSGLVPPATSSDSNKVLFGNGTWGIVITEQEVLNLLNNYATEEYVQNKTNRYACSWSNGTEEEIINMITAANQGNINLQDYWFIGDERDIELNATQTSTGYTEKAQTITMVLMHKGLYKDTSDNTVNYIVGMKDTMINDSYSHGDVTSWQNSSVRTWCNNKFRNAFTGSIGSIFRQFKTIFTPFGSSSNATTYDYFALPAEKEVYGSNVRSSNIEADVLTQFSYYTTASNRIKYHNTRNPADTPYKVNWLLRSHDYSEDKYFCIIDSNGGCGNISHINSCAVSPFGCI